MWEAIAAFIKSFSDKYLIPIVISILVAIAVIIFLPSDYWMIVKIGVLPFGVAVACITFLLVVLVYYVFGKIKYVIIDADCKRSLEKQYQTDIEDTIKKYWAIMDRCSPEERKMIRDLVKSGNQPITLSSNVSYFLESVYLSDLLVNSIILDDQGKRKRVYKLKEPCFQALKYSWDKHNKISNFD